VRRRAGALALLVLAGLVLAVAVVDHHRKQAHINRVQVDNWYCEHLGERCETPDSDVYEDRWERREQVYTGALVVLVLGSAGLALDRKSLEKGFKAARRNR